MLGPFKKAKKIKILFVCRDNSIRSPVAEALVNHFFSDRHEAYSAGIEPVEINPYVAKSLAKIGIDISKQHSKNINEFRTMQFDVIITLCDYVKTFSDHFPKSKKHLHIGLKEYCVPICCDYARKFCSCFPEYKKHFNKQFQDLSEDDVSEEEIITYFSFLRERIFDWFEKEAIF